MIVATSGLGCSSSQAKPAYNLPVSGRQPLSTLLSQALVAFIIEFDNEFEHQVPHRTTNRAATPGPFGAPWLVSMAMWTKLMRFIPEDGISVAALGEDTALDKKEFETWLTRMSKWWGYPTVESGQEPDAKRPGGLIVRPTPGGRKAIEVWRPLTAIIEERWEERFGAQPIASLRSAMRAIAEKLDPALPDSLPILGFQLTSDPRNKYQKEPANAIGKSEVPHDVPALLSRLLLSFAVEFESELGTSLAICANGLRVAGEKGVRIRDLPRLSGTSKEATALIVKRLQQRKLAAVHPEAPGSRAKVLVLTPSGETLRLASSKLIGEIEARWQSRYGSECVAGLRGSLEKLCGEPSVGTSPLFEGLRPHPDNWRASLPMPEVLPHFPMVLHRGGFPDGS